MRYPYPVEQRYSLHPSSYYRLQRIVTVELSLLCHMQVDARLGVKEQDVKAARFWHLGLACQHISSAATTSKLLYLVGSLFCTRS